MGCGTSRTTAVEPLRRSEIRRDQDDDDDDDDETSKLGSRGDSAVSKVTADSGVVMERQQDPSLPGAVPGKIPPLAGSPAGLLRDRGSPVERPPSSEIMEQLLSQGIIPVGPPRERSSGPGEAYDIMLDDGEVARRRPPARLESLKERKEQRSPSRDSIDHKMQQAEERRKQKEDELKTRLRTKSGRVRAPAAEPEDADPQEDPQEDPRLPTPVTTVAPDPEARTQVREDGRGETEGSERGERDSPGEGRVAGEEKEEREDEKKKKDEGGGEDDRGREEENREDREEGREEEDGEDRKEGRLGGGGGGEREGGDGGPSQDERLKLGQLLMSSGELESDPSFQNTDDMF